LKSSINALANYYGIHIQISKTITVAYLAIVDEPIAVNGQDDAAKAEWWPLSDFLDKPSGIAERPHLAFDHYDIMQDAIRKCNEIVK